MDAEPAGNWSVHSQKAEAMIEPILQIGLLAFPQITQLDLTGPFEALARLPNTKIHILWKTTEPVTSDSGLTLMPTTALDACPDLDVICIPGGPGQIDLMNDQVVIDFVRRQGEQAEYVTSVCTGALVLGAAGLLKGYKATTHWASMDNLALFGATPVYTRVCVDRNRITGGGVSAGIDFGLTLVGQLFDRETAESIQLFMQYTPEPPYASGTPDAAPQGVRDKVLAKMAATLERRKESSVRAAGRLEERPVA